ncbi:TadE/TadG family type IV pilus assembly protein [Alkalicoccobacillus gibsonii]|uniref:TadE/TadG family type IV pilus assembly protein n=1 Tax=Alkalicoccobacillus gibsonii TaxID=79881 RepID=UPI0019319024|nr:Tad domain-containing protein [Alkalicoccobacillus gibsonii]MBM0066639.1 hypothetical protein [Alkalicoccobacillus gibsonii]
MKTWLKKGFHKFVINENGAVSIYAIIMTLLLFVFNAVLIDYIRIMTAERNVDQAAKAAARSTMANFNQKLTSDYGLFGFDGDVGEANAIFEQVFRENLAPSQEDGIFNFAYPSYVSGSANVTFKENMNLASPDTAEYQILEDMKYKAPLEIGESVIEGFLSITKEVQEASEYAEVAEDVQEEVEKRDERLEKVEENLESAYTVLKSIEKNVKGEAAAPFPQVNNLNELYDHLDKYQEIRKAEEEAENREEDEGDGDGGEDEDESPTDEELDDANDYERNIVSFLEGILEDIEAFEQFLTSASNELKKAHEHNQAADTLLNEGSDKSGDYGEAQRAGDELREGSPSVNGENASEGIANAKEELQKLVIPEEFFESVQEALDQAIDSLETSENNLVKRVQELILIVEQKSMIKREQGKNIINEGIKNVKESFEITAQFFNEAYTEFGNKPEVEFERSEEEVEDEEETSEESLEEANEELDKLLSEAEALLKDQEEYNELVNLVNDYRVFASGADQSRELDRSTSKKMSESSRNMIDTLFNAIGEGLLGARDKLYLNEYILLRFNSHDFSKKDANGFGIDNNEVEFIMYGLDSSAANFGAAMSELFAFRFIINFVEAFTDGRVRSFGPYMWVAALSYALVNTIDDIRKFMSEERVSFFKNSRFRPEYKDYLRLFLFIHGQGNNLPRMMARIHQQTDSNLLEMPTYAVGEAEASLNLWFLPKLTEFLGETDIIDGYVEDGEFRIKKEAVYSY